MNNFKEAKILFFNKKETELGLPEKELWRISLIDFNRIEFCYPRVDDSGDEIEDETIAFFYSGADVIVKMSYAEVMKSMMER